MNGEFIVKDGKVFASDGKLRVLNNSDNFEEILVCENKIELLDDRINEINDDNNQNTVELKGIKRGIIKTLFTFILGIVCILGISIGLLESLLYGLWVTGVFILLSSFFIIKDFKGYRNMKNIIRALESEKTLLQKKLSYEKEKLDNLNKEICFTELNDETIEKIDNNLLLKEIDDEAIFYRTCGYYENEFLKYYKKGILKEELQKRNIFSDSQIAIIEKYFEENYSKENVNLKKRILRK